MIIRPRSVLVACFALALLAPVSAHAAHFGACYVDRYELTLCSNGCGITLAGSDFMLFVNKGAADVGAAEFFGAQFTVTSSSPDLLVHPFINNPGPQVAPIHPNEAVGSIGFLGDVLTPLLLAGETFRNTTPLQLLAFEVERVGPYVGPVTVNVKMKVGAETAEMVMLFDFKSGPHEIKFLHGARASSFAPPVAARQASWGQLKAMYR
jgi:hypothetical protein